MSDFPDLAVSSLGLNLIGAEILPAKRKGFLTTWRIRKMTRFTPTGMPRKSKGTGVMGHLSEGPVTWKDTSDLVQVHRCGWVPGLCDCPAGSFYSFPGSDGSSLRLCGAWQLKGWTLGWGRALSKWAVADIGATNLSRLWWRHRSLGYTESCPLIGERLGPGWIWILLNFAELMYRSSIFW